MTAGNLAVSLLDQEKYDEAVAMGCEVLAVEKRVLEAEHPSTLMTAGNLAVSVPSCTKESTMCRLRWSERCLP